MTTTFTDEKVKEIAEMLECGFSCYINKQNREFLLMPNPDNADMDLESWEDDLEKLNSWDYVTIDPPRSFDSFKIMEEFIDTLAENPALQNTLIRALEKRKPFREFKFAVDNSGEYRQKWFDFKSEKYRELVKAELAFIFEEEDE